MAARKARHAIAAGDKLARREAILKAANALFVAGAGSLPTAARIAAATGLAKGTVYLYFRTKEEIFAALLLEGWSAAMENLQNVFRDIIPDTGGARTARVNAFIESFVDHLEKYPGLLRLDALGYGILEKNMEPEALRIHKRDFTDRVFKAGKSIDDSLRLPDGRGVQLLMRTYALTRGLWQSFQDSEDAMLAGVDAGLRLAPAAYGGELKEALTEYWRGAMA